MRKSLESRTTVDLHKALKSGDIAHSVLVKSLIEAYKRDDTSIIGNFLELFLKSLGTCCEINLGRVANAIQKGLLLDFVKEILISIENYDEDKYIFNDPTTLDHLNEFLQEFCSSNNPILRDVQIMDLLTVSLATFTQFPTEYTISIGAYFSLKFAHDLEILRVEMKRKAQTSASSRDDEFLEMIEHFLKNTYVSLALSRSCLDHFSTYLSALVRSSPEIYIMDRSILEQLMSIVLVKHKCAKEALTLFDYILKNTGDTVKMCLVEFLANYTDTLIKLMSVDNVSVQVAAIKVLLSCQRLMGKVAFLLPNQNQMVYRKMTSTNNNMRECAKRFFMNTYTNPNTMVDAGKQTMLKALMIQCEKYPDSLQNVPVIINLLWRNLPPFDDFVNQVCATKNPIAYKIFFFLVKKIMEPDVSEEIRRNLINEILQKFRYFAAACEDVHEMHVTVIDMLFHMNLKKYLTHQHDVSMRQMVEFTLDKMKNTTDIPTLYMMNMLLYQLAEINSFATEKIKSVMKEWAGRFIERRDESVLEHLSSAVYVHNTNEVLPQKKRTDLLRITKSIIDEVESHNNRIIHQIILIHADLLCTNWGQPGTDRAELKKVAKELIDFHILPFMTFDFRDDQIFNLKILQAFSLILAHFVKHKVREMNTMWGEMQVTFYKFIQQAIFSSLPKYDDEENDKSIEICRTIMNCVYNTIDIVQSPNLPVHSSISKYIFHLVKSYFYQDAVHDFLVLLAKNKDNLIKILGSVCHCFTFYTDEKTIRLFFQEVDRVIVSMEPDEAMRNDYRHRIVLHYIENVGNFMKKKYEEGEGSQQSTEEAAKTRLGVLRYTKDLLKHCNADQKKDIINAQKEFFKVEYLNSVEKESVKAFVKSLS